MRLLELQLEPREVTTVDVALMVAAEEENLEPPPRLNSREPES